MAVEQVPTSLGVFNPVGWVRVGVPTQAEADALPAVLCPSLAVHDRALTVKELI